MPDHEEGWGVRQDDDPTPDRYQQKSCFRLAGHTAILCVARTKREILSRPPSRAPRSVALSIRTSVHACLAGIRGMYLIPKIEGMRQLHINHKFSLPRLRLLPPARTMIYWRQLIRLPAGLGSIT